MSDRTGVDAVPPPDAIDFILREHDRQFEFCGTLEDLVNALDLEPIAAAAETLLSYLGRDLRLHIEDEELDLFPALASHCAEDPRLGEILQQLASEHEADSGLAELLVQDLRAIAEGRPPGHPLRFYMNVRAFCETQRRHLDWENRIVLPLAEKLLTGADRHLLGQRMAARRR